MRLARGFVRPGPGHMTGAQCPLDEAHDFRLGFQRFGKTAGFPGYFDDTSRLGTKHLECVQSLGLSG